MCRIDRRFVNTSKNKGQWSAIQHTHTHLHTHTHTHTKLILRCLYLKMDGCSSSSLFGTFLTAGLMQIRIFGIKQISEGYTDLTLHRSQIFLKHSKDCGLSEAQRGAKGRRNWKKLVLDFCPAASKED